MVDPNRQFHLQVNDMAILVWLDDESCRFPKVEKWLPVWASDTNRRGLMGGSAWDSTPGWRRIDIFLNSKGNNMSDNKEIRTAHKHCKSHKEEILSSALCGCFYCLATFSPTEIVDWLDENPTNAPATKRTGQTALCPRCGIDSVVGSASGYPITNEFLQKMRLYWFW